MQLVDLEEIKAVLWEQASQPCTKARWGTAQVRRPDPTRGNCWSCCEGFRAGIKWKLSPLKDRRCVQLVLAISKTGQDEQEAEREVAVFAHESTESSHRSFIGGEI